MLEETRIRNKPIKAGIAFELYQLSRTTAELSQYEPPLHNSYDSMTTSLDPIYFTINLNSSVFWIWILDGSDFNKIQTKMFFQSNLEFDLDGQT